MDNSAQMLIFAKVVEQGSISAAARSIGQTPSAVSKQVALLEDYVHHRLLNRTRTGVMPTQEGQQFYEKCKALADKYDEAEEMVRNMDGIPRGTLKIASTVAFGKSQLLPALPAFMKSYPEVRLSLDLTDREIDLQGEGFDVAICFAEQHKNPDIVARRIMQSQRVLCLKPMVVLKATAPTSFFARRLRGSGSRVCPITWPSGSSIQASLFMLCQSTRHPVQISLLCLQSDATYRRKPARSLIFSWSSFAARNSFTKAPRQAPSKR